MIFSISGQKAAALLLSLCYVGTQVLFAHVPESRFWEERRRHKNESPRTSAAGAGALASASSMADLPAAGKITGVLPVALKPNLPPALLARMGPLLETLSGPHGTLRAIALPPKETGLDTAPVVIHIQDVHQNTGAQRCIAGVLRALAGAGGDAPQILALEGAFGPLNFERYRAFPDRNALRNAADYLLDAHGISGPVRAALDGADAFPVVVGVDDEKIHAANVQAYLRSAPLLSAVQGKISALGQDLSRRKESLYNPALRALDAGIHARRDGALSLGDYVDTLARHARPGPQASLLLQAFKIESSLDLKRTEAERARLIETLSGRLSNEETRDLAADALAHRLGRLSQADFYRRLQDLCAAHRVDLSGLPALDAYVRCLLIVDRINGESLFGELPLLEKSALAALASTSAERRLIEEDRALHLAGKLAAFSLSPAEWSEYEKTHGVHPALPGTDLSPFEDFYKEARARDAAMADNLLAEIRRRGASRAVLVAGGFHAPGLTKRLTAAGCAVLTFSPSFETGDGPEGPSYLGVFAREKTPLEKIFRGEKLFLAQDPRKDISLLPVLVGAEQVRKAGGKDAARVFSLALERLSEKLPGYSLEVEDPRWEEDRVKATLLFKDGQRRLDHRVEIDVRFSREGKMLKAVQTGLPSRAPWGLRALQGLIAPAHAVLIHAPLYVRRLLGTAEPGDLLRPGKRGGPASLAYWIARSFGAGENASVAWGRAGLLFEVPALLGGIFFLQNVLEATGAAPALFWLSKGVFFAVFAALHAGLKRASSPREARAPFLTDLFFFLLPLAGYVLAPTLSFSPSFPWPFAAALAAPIFHVLMDERFFQVFGGDRPTPGMENLLTPKNIPSTAPAAARLWRDLSRWRRAELRRLRRWEARHAAEGVAAETARRYRREVLTPAETLLGSLSLFLRSIDEKRLARLLSPRERARLGGNGPAAGGTPLDRLPTQAAAFKEALQGGWRRAGDGALLAARFPDLPAEQRERWITDHRFFTAGAETRPSLRERILSWVHPASDRALLDALKADTFRRESLSVSRERLRRATLTGLVTAVLVFPFFAPRIPPSGPPASRATAPLLISRDSLPPLPDVFAPVAGETSARKKQPAPLRKPSPAPDTLTTPLVQETPLPDTLPLAPLANAPSPESLWVAGITGEKPLKTDSSIVDRRQFDADIAALRAGARVEKVVASARSFTAKDGPLRFVEKILRPGLFLMADSTHSPEMAESLAQAADKIGPAAGRAVREFSAVYGAFVFDENRLKRAVFALQDAFLEKDVFIASFSDGTARFPRVILYPDRVLGKEIFGPEAFKRLKVPPTPAPVVIHIIDGRGIPTQEEAGYFDGRHGVAMASRSGQLLWRFNRGGEEARDIARHEFMHALDQWRWINENRRPHPNEELNATLGPLIFSPRAGKYLRALLMENAFASASDRYFQAAKGVFNGVALKLSEEKGVQLPVMTDTSRVSFSARMALALAKVDNTTLNAWGVDLYSNPGKYLSSAEAVLTRERREGGQNVDPLIQGSAAPSIKIPRGFPAQDSLPIFSPAVHARPELFSWESRSRAWEYNNFIPINRLGPMTERELDPLQWVDSTGKPKFIGDLSFDSEWPRPSPTEEVNAVLSAMTWLRAYERKALMDLDSSLADSARAKAIRGVIEKIRGLRRNVFDQAVARDKSAPPDHPFVWRQPARQDAGFGYVDLSNRLHHLATGVEIPLPPDLPPLHKVVDHSDEVVIVEGGDGRRVLAGRVPDELKGVRFTDIKLYPRRGGADERLALIWRPGDPRGWVVIWSHKDASRPPRWWLRTFTSPALFVQDVHISAQGKSIFQTTANGKLSVAGSMVLGETGRESRPGLLIHVDSLSGDWLAQERSGYFFGPLAKKFSLHPLPERMLDFKSLGDRWIGNTHASLIGNLPKDPVEQFDSPFLLKDPDFIGGGLPHVFPDGTWLKLLRHKNRERLVGPALSPQDPLRRPQEFHEHKVWEASKKWLFLVALPNGGVGITGNALYSQNPLKASPPAGAMTTYRKVQGFSHLENGEWALAALDNEGWKILGSAPSRADRSFLFTEAPRIHLIHDYFYAFGPMPGDKPGKISLVVIHPNGKTLVKPGIFSRLPRIAGDRFRTHGEALANHSTLFSAHNAEYLEESPPGTRVLAEEGNRAIIHYQSRRTVWLPSKNEEVDLGSSRVPVYAALGPDHPKDDLLLLKEVKEPFEGKPTYRIMGGNPDGIHLPETGFLHDVSLPGEEESPNAGILFRIKPFRVRISEPYESGESFQFFLQDRLQEKPHRWRLEPSVIRPILPHLAMIAAVPLTSKEYDLIPRERVDARIEQLKMMPDSGEMRRHFWDLIEEVVDGVGEKYLRHDDFMELLDERWPIARDQSYRMLPNTFREIFRRISEAGHPERGLEMLLNLEKAKRRRTGPADYADLDSPAGWTKRLNLYFKTHNKDGFLPPTAQEWLFSKNERRAAREATDLFLALSSPDSAAIDSIGPLRSLSESLPAENSARSKPDVRSAADTLERRMGGKERDLILPLSPDLFPAADKSAVERVNRVLRELTPPSRRERARMLSDFHARLELLKTDSTSTPPAPLVQVLPSLLNGWIASLRAKHGVDSLNRPALLWASAHRPEEAALFGRLNALSLSSMVGKDAALARDLSRLERALSAANLFLGQDGGARKAFEELSRLGRLSLTHSSLDEKIAEALLPPWEFRPEDRTKAASLNLLLIDHLSPGDARKARKVLKDWRRLLAVWAGENSASFPDEKALSPEETAPMLALLREKSGSPRPFTAELSPAFKGSLSGKILLALWNGPRILHWRPGQEERFHRLDRSITGLLGPTWPGTMAVPRPVMSAAREAAREHWPYALSLSLALLLAHLTIRHRRETTGRRSLRKGLSLLPPDTFTPELQRALEETALLAEAGTPSPEGLAELRHLMDALPASTRPLAEALAMFPFEKVPEDFSRPWRFVPYVSALSLWLPMHRSRASRDRQSFNDDLLRLLHRALDEEMTPDAFRRRFEVEFIAPESTASAPSSGVTPLAAEGKTSRSPKILDGPWPALRWPRLVTGPRPDGTPSGRAGRGTFAEIREYVPGDAPSTIDWNAYARTGRIMVREEHQESLAWIALAVDAAPFLHAPAEARQAAVEEVLKTLRLTEPTGVAGAPSTAQPRLAVLWWRRADGSIAQKSPPSGLRSAEGLRRWAAGAIEDWIRAETAAEEDAAPAWERPFYGPAQNASYRARGDALLPRRDNRAGWDIRLSDARRRWGTVNVFTAGFSPEGTTLLAQALQKGRPRGRLFAWRGPLAIPAEKAKINKSRGGNMAALFVGGILLPLMLMVGAPLAYTLSGQTIFWRESDRTIEAAPSSAEEKAGALAATLFNASRGEPAAGFNNARDILEWIPAPGSPLEEIASPAEQERLLFDRAFRAALENRFGRIPAREELGAWALSSLRGGTPARSYDDAFREGNLQQADGWMVLADASLRDMAAFVDRTLAQAGDKPVFWAAADESSRASLKATLANRGQASAPVLIPSAPPLFPGGAPVFNASAADTAAASAPRFKDVRSWGVILPEGWLVLPERIPAESRFAGSLFLFVGLVLGALRAREFTLIDLAEQFRLSQKIAQFA